jgi:hypothetical protein
MIAHETLTGACILASMNLISPGIHDVATLDCELHRLQILTAADASEWDEFATACLSKEALTNSQNCPRIPMFQVGETPVYPLYQEETALAFFDTQTSTDSEHCTATKWFVPTSDPHAGPDSTTCSCPDLIALKTLGSRRRTQVLNAHRARTEAANSVRNRRKIAADVLKRALALRCDNANIDFDCPTVRSAYKDADDAARTATHGSPIAAVVPEYMSPTTVAH